VGKSRTTVTEALSIANLPEKVREECRRADITAKSTLLQIVRQPDEAAMYQLVGEVAANSLNRDAARAVRKAKQAGETAKKRPEPPQFTYSQPEGEFRVEIKFNKANPVKVDIVSALKEILAHLESPAESDNDSD
jgi:ParB family chromosome partitioning protein